ncbi:MAG: ABC transporter permease [Bacillota bacterium]
MDKIQIIYARNKRERVIFKIIIPVLTVITFLILWEVLVYYGIIPSRYLPRPSELARTFIVKLSDPNPEGATLLLNIISSLKISITGFFLALLIGIPLGLLMGWYKAVDRFVKPLFEMIRPIPPIAWIPLTILLLGIGFRAKVFIIFFSAFVPCVINSYTGIKLTNPTLINVAKTCGASNFQLFLKVGIPSSVQMIFAGIKVALGASWSTLVAAEMLASNSGLGFMILMGRLFARPDLILLGMIIIGVIGALMLVILSKFESKLARWRSIK